MSGISGLAPVPLYNSIAQNEQKYVQASLKSDPAAETAVSAFEKVAPSLTSAKALLGNYSALQFVLNAFSMGSMIGETGILKDLLTQNPNSSTSLAQQLANPTYLKFAQFFSNWNPPPLSNPANVKAVVNQYNTNQFEQAQGAQTPGMQQALYFTRTIGSATSIQQIMADPTLLGVVTTALGQPPEFGLLNYNQQVAILTKGLTLSKFQSPSYVQSFVQKFLVLNQENPPAPPGPTGTLALFSNGSSQTGSILSLFG